MFDPLTATFDSGELARLRREQPVSRTGILVTLGTKDQHRSLCHPRPADHVLRKCDRNAIEGECRPERTSGRR